MDDEREEGEIVDLNDDDFYENIISSDDDVVEEDEDALRKRIQELEAKNLELEKIASISKTYDYGLGCGSSNFIDLVDDDDGGDDDESYFRQPSKYEYSSYTSSRRKSSHNKRRKACRHDSKKSKRYKPYKSERRKKPSQPNRSRLSSDSSSDEYTTNERNKLQAALKRNTSSINSTTLKRKLIGVSKTVEDFIKEKEDVGDEDISTSIEIMHLLNKINIEEIAPKKKATVLEDDTGLTEQELRLIALKSAILKKAEARKKRKIIETQPYSPTDDVVIESVIAAKTTISVKPKEELDNMEISPPVSPANQDGCLQPIDMELESDDDSQKVLDTQQETHPTLTVPKSADLSQSIIVPVPDEISLINAKVPESTDQVKLSFDSPEQRNQQEEDEDDEEALRASLLANLTAKKKTLATTATTQKTSIEEDPLPLEKTFSDTSVETERLRKQAISSMGKRKLLLPNPFAQKFSVQVPKPVEMPKPIEMSMPQITSNLKTALKRILSEKDKQNVEGDAIKILQTVIPEPAKENPIDVNSCRTTQADIIELKNIAQKLNGAILSQKSTLSEPNLILKKTCEPTTKLNEVLKTIASSETIVAVKESKEPIATINDVSKKVTKSEPSPAMKTPCEPIVKSKDVPKNVTTNESTAVMKKPCEPTANINDVLKNVTKDSANVPLVLSNKIEITPLDKSDTAIRLVKTVTQKKVSAEPNLSLNQKENQLLRKVVLSSKRISEEKPPVAKKPKIVNNVKASRVITTPVEKPVKKLIIQLNNSDTDSDDFGFGQESMETSTNGKSYSGVASPASYTYSPASPATLADNKSLDGVLPNSVSFQQKLDEYLKSARTKVDQTKQETKPLKKSPSLVSHLPPSSQLEYRKLINRMALLEKQKQLKSKIAASKQKPSSNISVTIANDLCNHQPKSEQQVVQLNGIDSVSTKKETQTEGVVALRNVDPPKSTESSIVTRTCTTTVVTDSGTKVNNDPNVPKINVEPSETVPAKTEEPDQSTNLIKNFSALSEHNKLKILQKSEAEYMSYSDLYLVDLNNMSQLVNKARQEKEKQFQIESEIEELEARVHELKNQLVEQKVSVSKLYPIISSSHKNIMKKRSKSLQLHKKCYCVGNKIVGADYKIPGDPKADIAEKVKSLSSETKLLRNMKKPVVTESKAPISNDEKCLKTEPVNGDTPVATANQSAIVISFNKPDDVPSLTNGTSDNIPISNSMMNYKSPLDHMGSIGITYPDSIVCPFQLLGQCEDKECTYQHLS